MLAQMKQRLNREAAPIMAADLWSAAYILMGLRYEQALIQRLLQGVVTMKGRGYGVGGRRASNGL